MEKTTPLPSFAKAVLWTGESHQELGDLDRPAVGWPWQRVEPLRASHTSHVYNLKEVEWMTSDLIPFPSNVEPLRHRNGLQASCWVGKDYSIIKNNVSFRKVVEDTDRFGGFVCVSLDGRVMCGGSMLPCWASTCRSNPVHTQSSSRR